MKGNKGITLIALVITIIVLLILAGVSIAMLSGDNSILKNAQAARDNSAAGTLDETVKLAVGNIMTANLGWPTDVTGAATNPSTEAAKLKDLKTQIESVNANISSLSVTDPATGKTAFTVTGTINGKVQTVYVVKGTGAVSTTNPDA